VASDPKKFKRTGFALMAAFLEINECEFEADPEDIVNIFTDLAAGTLAETEFSAWVVTHTLAGSAPQN
jgi:prophage maintenance system killer protein